MCNRYSIITNQAAIAALFRVTNRYTGNLAPMPKRVSQISGSGDSQHRSERLCASSMVRILVRQTSPWFGRRVPIVDQVTQETAAARCDSDMLIWRLCNKHKGL